MRRTSTIRLAVEIDNVMLNRHNDLREKLNLLKVRSKNYETNRSTLNFHYNHQWVQGVFSRASRGLHQQQHIHQVTNLASTTTTTF